MNKQPYQAIVIGASAGGVDALSRLLPQLPADFAMAVFVVIHLPPSKDSVLAELLQDKCAMRVREAEASEPIEAGTIYIAPPDYHLLVEKNGQLSLSSDEPVLFSRPSIDVLFESAADAYGPGLIGVVLTGANEDGAQGLKAIVAQGGMALVQQPKKAFATMMPEAAIKACPTAHVMEIPEIATFLQEAA